MKKIYRYLLSFTAAMLISTGLSHAQQRVLEEGFENTQAGELPDGWTQLPAQGTKNWMVEVDNGQLVDPKSPAEGKAHIKLVDRNSGGTERAVKLVTPAFNTQSLAEPILIFNHVAIEHAGNVVDSLYVYYRLQEEYPWMPAGSFGANDFWQTDTISFGPKSRTFQVAFEGVNNGARGVALDGIRFTSRPTCQPPTDVSVYNILHDEAKIRWAGEGTLQYHVKLFETEQTDPATAADVVFEETVLYNTNCFFRGDNIKPATEYYYYIQADAGYGDVSPWVSGKFRTACEPVRSFSTSFDEPEDMACWTAMQQGFGDFATRWAPEYSPAPYNVSGVRRFNGYHEDGSEFWEYFTDPQPRTGKSSLHFHVQSESKADYNKLYAVSPRLADDVDLTNMQISFWARTNTRQLHLRLMVTEWPDDFSNAETAGEIVFKATDAYERFLLTFDETQAKGKYIVFMVDGGEENVAIQSPQIDIDDIVLEEKENCSAETKVALFGRPVTTDETATLSWNATGVKSWNVKVSTVSINPAVDEGNLYDSNITGTPTVSVERLTPGTRYFYYVQPVCQDGVKGAWCNEQYFDTDCVADGLEMPFRENFDKYKMDDGSNQGILPPCWTMKGEGTISLETDEEAYTLYGYVSTYGVTNGYLITPKLNAELNKCQVRFACCSGSLDLPFALYVMEDPNDPSTYVEIEEFYVDAIRNYAGFNWKVLTVSLESYEGTGQYVAFKFPDGIWGCGIDDVVVEPLAACADPAGFAVTNTDINAISLAWKATGSESEWDIAYCKAGGILGKNTTEVHVTADNHTITGLDENTAYDFYLRSDCGGDELKGRWIGPLQARTIAPAQAPYVCDFEDASIAGAWQLLNGTQVNQWIIGNAVKDENGGTGNTLFISDTYGTSNHFSPTDTYLYACRLFEFQTGTFDFEFDWRLNGWWERVTNSSPWGGSDSRLYNNAVLIPFLVPENLEIQAGIPDNLQFIQCSGDSEQTMKAMVRGNNTVIPEGWIPLTDSILSAKGDDWYHFKKTIQVKQAGRYRLVLAYAIEGSNSNNDLLAAAIDNVKVTLNTTYCLPAEDMRVFNVRTDRAQVEFNSYNATKWDVIVTDSAYAEADLDTITTVGGHVIFMETQNAPLPLNISGLSPETQYWVAVRPDCGNDVDWTSTDFFTICEAVGVPLVEDFENPTANGFLDCWRRLPVKMWSGAPASGPSIGYIGTTGEAGACAANNLTQVMRMQEVLVKAGGESVGHEGYIVTPELAADVKTLQMSFRATAVKDYADEPFTLEVGVMDDPVDTATFTFIESIKLKYAAQWKTYTTYFDEYKGTGKHLAIRLKEMGGYSGSCYVDDVNIDVISGCTPAREITVSNITGSSADLEWRILTAPTNYHVKVFTRAMGRWEETGDVFDGIVRGTNKYQLAQLRGAKQYYVYVRTVCSEEGGKVEYSSGISEAIFRTGCPEREILPFTENFDNYELNEYPACWTTSGRGPVPYTNGSSYALESNRDIILKPQGRFMLMISSTSYVPGISVLPEMDDKLQDLTLTFDGAQIGVGSGLIVGVISDLADPNSFTPIDTATPPRYNEWETFRVDMSKYKGTGTRIAFYLAPAWNGDAYAIDNVMVRKTTMTCPDATAPQALNVTTDGATLRWADNENANHFELKVADHEINPEVDEGNVINAERRDETSTTLSALTPNTVYYAYIRNVCDDGSVGYWSQPVTFRTLCDDVLSAATYFEDFSGYGEIADNGFFPECWRNRVQIYGGISPGEQVAPYVENASIKSMLMKAVYAKNTNDYAVVDAATPVITFEDGKNLADYYMTLRIQSSDVNGKLYVGVMSDPADGSTFVAYDTLSVSTANAWEEKLVNFLYAPSEAHIAFRVNSLDAQVTYQAKFTDIRLHELPDCMPPYKVNVDLRPEKAFVSWLPGDETNREWKYYYSKNSSQMTIPFTDEEWEAKNGNRELNVTGTTTEPRLAINGLKAWSTYYFYVKNTACDKFYPVAIKLSPKGCSDLTAADLPYYEDFSTHGAGYTDAEPQYSAYPDCWTREDGYVGDKVSYPYIDADHNLYFKAVDDTINTAYVKGLSADDSGLELLNGSQMRFTAQGLGAADTLFVGVTHHYLRNWSEDTIEFIPADTIYLTATPTEYVVELSGIECTFDHSNNDHKELHPVFITGRNTEVKMQELYFEAIPYCLTPEPKLVSVDKDMLSINWNRLEDQGNWEVAIGKAGFDPDMADAEPRIDTTYRTMGLEEGTAYELYVHALCGNGLTSDWGKLAVTTRQTPAAYPYGSTDLGDGTHLVADTVNYAYRTIDLPAGPHVLSFDYRLADNAGSYLRVFLVPESEMITTQSDFGMTVDAIPAGWTELATYSTATQWTSVNSKLQVPYGTEAACNVVFVWTKNGDDPTAVVRNIEIKAGSECTVPEALAARQVTATSAMLTWVSYNSGQYAVFYGKGTNTSETGFCDVPYLEVTGLEPDTEYCFQVQATCNTGMSEKVTFRTACAPVSELVEDFDNGLGECWQTYHGLADEVMADPNKLQLQAGGWTLTDRELIDGSKSQHAMLTVEGSDCAWWLISPAVQLTENTGLSFDLALTAYNAQSGVQNVYGQTDDRFMVLVSADEGRTWNEACVTEWNNRKNNKHSFNRIGNAYQRMEVDLSSYTGKTVRIAFYGESTIELESNDIHIDNIGIECRTVQPTIEAHICTGYPYEGNGFRITREDNDHAGVFNYTRREDNPNGCAFTYNLRLTVGQSYEVNYDRTICQGDNYADDNFSLTYDAETQEYTFSDPQVVVEGNAYTKIYSAKNGCDSVVTMYLTVNPSYELNRSFEIRRDQLPYTFACYEILPDSKSGKINIECKTVNGCDSIIHLDLTILGGDGLDEAYGHTQFTLSPNPVERGKWLNVQREFSPAELQGMEITVVNSLGMECSRVRPATSHVSIQAPEVSGVYMVRIITGTKQTLTGRFIVK